MNTILSRQVAKFLLPFVLLSCVASAASSERINLDRQCESKAQWAGEVFDIIEANPKVILSGMEADDVNAFAFIRKWSSEGKTREDLILWVRSRCVGVEV